MYKRQELFYWATVTVAFALGTAVGDFTATVAKLGYFGSGLLFTGLILLPALGFWLGRTNSVLMFWIAYVLTRPLGASYADWMGKPKIVEGLGWGSGSVALVPVSYTHLDVYKRQPLSTEENAKNVARRLGHVRALSLIHISLRGRASLR